MAHIRISLPGKAGVAVFLFFFLSSPLMALSGQPDRHAGDDLKTYHAEVTYRMRSLQAEATADYPDLLRSGDYQYDPGEILKRVSSLAGSVYNLKDPDWWSGMKAGLLRLWRGLPPVSAENPPEEWLKRNLDRFFITYGFELLEEPVLSGVKEAILDINKDHKRETLVQIWREADAAPLSRLEYPESGALPEPGVSRKESGHWRTFRNRDGEPLIIAHRGGYSGFPENSLAAFRNAYQLGADGIECDLRLSRDGVVFVLHDNDLKRVTGRAVQTGALNQNQLEGLKLRDSFDPALESSESPLTLMRLLKQYGGKMLLWLELKPDGGDMLPKEVGDLLDRYHLVEQVIVSSFSPDMLEPLRARFPKLILAYEFGMPDEAAVRHLLEAADSSRFIISGDHLETGSPGLVSELRRAGIRTSSFTLNRFDAIQKAIGSGIRLIQTDRPDRALLLREKQRKG